MNDAQSALGRVCGVRARAGTWLGSRRGGIESRGWIHFGEIGRAAHAVARTRTPVSAHQSRVRGQLGQRDVAPVRGSW